MFVLTHANWSSFTMYRLRTADKGKPLIISDKIIKDYADCVVDTLHKKNLLSLGEDRYLTTLMTKYFPAMMEKNRERTMKLNGLCYETDGDE